MAVCVTTLCDRRAPNNTQPTPMASRIGHALVAAAQNVDGACKLQSICPESLTDGGGTVVAISVPAENVDAVLSTLRTRWPLVTVSTSTCGLTGANLVTTFVPSHDELSKLAMDGDFQARRWLSTMIKLVAAASATAFITTMISALANSD